MPHYVVLVNFTDQGIRTIQELPKRVQEANRTLAAEGVKLTRYFTLGAYDMVVIAEATSDEAQLAGLLGIGAQGNLRTATLKAFTEKEFLDVVKQLPAPAAAAPGAPRRGRARR
ncbi:MAG: GYD domain-containing protein [Chloroflexi bacterium]|nr:GYD domain-containing protein [Chloroflexota bacterium]